MSDTPNIDPTIRFSDRVDNYTRFRPGYPLEALQAVFDHADLDANSVVADIGAGTGIFTHLLLQSGSSVVAVEPNEPMRNASDARLGSYRNYSSVPGSAEETGLADQSVDLITAAQAFHWFDYTKTRKEFDRILKLQGRVILIWNRRDSKSPFQKAYDNLLRVTLPEYNKVNHTNATDERIGGFLGPGMRMEEYPNFQKFDLDGLKGRLMSASYCPAPGAAGHANLMGEIESLYREHAEESGVQFDYRTQVYLG